MCHTTFFLIGDSSVKSAQQAQKRCDASIRMSFAKNTILERLFLNLK